MISRTNVVDFFIFCVVKTEQRIYYSPLRKIAVHYLGFDLDGWGLFFYNIGMNPQLLEFVQNAFLKPGKALDLGCGDQTDMHGLEKIGWTCDGVDIKTGVDLNFLYLSDASPYDLVYTNFVIQKLEKPEVLVETIARNLDSGGKFFVQTFHPTDPYADIAFTEQELTQLLEASGLEVDEVAFFPFDEGAPDFHHHMVLQAFGKKR